MNGHPLGFGQLSQSSISREQHGPFRFVQGRDSVWRKHVLQTDEVETQWGNMMRVLGVDVTYALSPQAKGKVERPYQ